MAVNFKEALRAERAEREAQNLQRELRWLEEAHGVEVAWEGRRFINFSSNDYLGLAHHPALKAAAIAATERYGSGSGAARLVCGTLPPHRELEETLAKFKGAEAALSFASGYTAAIGAICALAGSGDVVILDKLAHASLVDGARLSGAKLRVFRHNDVGNLAEILDWTRREKPGARVLIVTESVFSMDGDVAPLLEIADLKDQFGAWLMVDEAHALGVLGPEGRGLIADLAPGRVEVQMGTLGKAAGASGGFIAGSVELIDHLINSARSFIFSTAPAPGGAAAARTGIEMIAGAEGEARRTQLRENVRRFRQKLPMPPPAKEGVEERLTAIAPVILGDEVRTIEASKQLKAAGFLVPAIRYPTVARGAARLRITLSAAHSADQIEALADEIQRLLV